MKGVKPASVSETSFVCPHCGTFTSQKWLRVYLNYYKPNETPTVITTKSFGAHCRAVMADAEIDEGLRDRLINRADKMSEGRPFIDLDEKVLTSRVLENLYLSECFTCGKLAVWRHDTLLYPNEMTGDEPNPDMPGDVRADYDEARTILSASPRGAAALLRLAIQKLCVCLGQPGKNINDDIGSLVANGLPIQIQQALDAVRVIGNEAVHPGELDLRDDRDIVIRLLKVINVVVDNQISQPRHVSEVYAMIPASKSVGIDERNAKALRRSDPDKS